jgi:hypothetical protein
MRRRVSTKLGSAMIEAGLCLAVFTPLVFAAVRLSYGASQMHELQETVTEAAKAGGACAPAEEIRAIALKHLPLLPPENVVIEIDRETEPATIHVSIKDYRVVRLTSVEPLPQAPSARFPYPCE